MEGSRGRDPEAPDEAVRKIPGEHEVVVANAHDVACITRGSRTSDKVDPELPARLDREDSKLLSPLRRRSEQAQRDLAVIRAWAVVVTG